MTDNDDFLVILFGSITSPKVNTHTLPTLNLPSINVEKSVPLKKSGFGFLKM